MKLNRRQCFFFASLAGLISCFHPRRAKPFLLLGSTMANKVTQSLRSFDQPSLSLSVDHPLYIFHVEIIKRRWTASRLALRSSGAELRLLIRS